MSIYRLYLFFNDMSLPVGYGALKLCDHQLYVTECVGANHRGQGCGHSILDSLVFIAQQEKRDLIAEIWATNERSIALHEKAGFVLESSSIKLGQELRRYCLKDR